MCRARARTQPQARARALAVVEERSWDVADVGLADVGEGSVGPATGVGRDAELAGWVEEVGREWQCAQLGRIRWHAQPAGPHVLERVVRDEVCRAPCGLERDGLQARPAEAAGRQGGREAGRAWLVVVVKPQSVEASQDRDIYMMVSDCSELAPSVCRSPQIYTSRSLMIIVIDHQS